MGQPATKYARRLEPLTRAEVERMRNVYANHPLTTTKQHTTVDEALKKKGWVEQYDDEPDTVTPTKAAYRADNGGCVLYDDRGMVHDCWRTAD